MRVLKLDRRFTVASQVGRVMKDVSSTDSNETLSEQEQKELAASLGSEPPESPLQATDLHTRAMVSRVRERVSGWTAQGPSAAGIPRTHGPLEKIDVIPGILVVPAHDEDGEKISFIKRALFRTIRALPLTDNAAPWPSAESASKTITTEFLRFLPPRPMEWTEVTSDRAMGLLAFQGLAAHRLMPLDVDPEGAAYVVDLSWMQAYPVRPELERYGASAYFAADRTPLRVYTSHDDRTHRPGDASWEDAKWHWRCSVFAAVTVADHLGATHFLASNLLVTSIREQLPENHPLRRFLKAFGYGAVDVNVDAALMLAPERGLAHRMFAFDYSGLSRCLLRGVETMTFQPFPQAMADKRVDTLGDKYPYATDGLALYGVFQDYANEYLDIFFPGESVAQDSDVRAWWRRIVELAPNLALAPLSKRQQVIDLVTQFMFTVTAFHAQVGGVVTYLLDPQFISTKIRAGTRMSDLQATVQVLNLCALTALVQPTLIGDYTHLFLEENAERAISAFKCFQQALIKLSADIEERNKQRDQPFETFNPRLLTTSVST